MSRWSIGASRGTRLAVRALLGVSVFASACGTDGRVTLPLHPVSFRKGVAYAGAIGVNAIDGQKPNWVAIGRLNGDAAPDLAVTRYDQGTVSVLLNVGDGTFSAATGYDTDISPSSVAVADIDNDGANDLVVGRMRESDNSVPPEELVRVFRNAGDGTFLAPESYDTTKGRGDVAVGDLNGDGSVDIAVTATALVNVLMNDGSGKFAVPAAYPVELFAELVVEGDVNGDQRSDLVVTGGYGIALLLNRGDGTFGPKTTIPSASTALGAAFGDFDGDGRVDLATANPGSTPSNVSGSMSVFFGRGDGTFSPETNYPSENTQTSLGVGDFNGDGRLDVVTVSLDGKVAAVFLNRGAGVFAAPATFDLGTMPASLAVGDLNGDGKPDLAVGDYGGPGITVLLNDSHDMVSP